MGKRADLTLEQRTLRRKRCAWYFYDFGNSAYAAVVLLAVYAAYFQSQVVGGAQGSRLWGLSVGVAMFIVAAISPVLGAIADYSSAKKQFLIGFTALACVFTAASRFFTIQGTSSWSPTRQIMAAIAISIWRRYCRVEPNTSLNAFIMRPGPFSTDY